jgi:hypothetical protein
MIRRLPNDKLSSLIKPNFIPQIIIQIIEIHFDNFTSSHSNDHITYPVKAYLKNENQIFVIFYEKKKGEISNKLNVP